MTAFARLQTSLDRCLVGLVVLAIWQGANLWVGDYWVATPLATAKGLLDSAAEVLRHTGFTVEAALAGLVIGCVPGVLLPLIFRRFPTVMAVLDPFMVCGYGLPKLALAPLFILWFGIGVASKVALVASVVFFILYFNMVAGIRSIDGKTIRVARVLGASEYDILRKIVWPSCLPFIFAGLQIALPYAIGGVVISELISSNRGLGYLVQYSAMNFSTLGVFVAVAAITIVCVAMNGLLSVVEFRMLRWRSGMKTDAWA